MHRNNRAGRSGPTDYDGNGSIGEDNGDPSTDITATRSIAAVWKNGIPVVIG